MTIQLICASKDADRAADFRRLLAAEGADVDVVTRKLESDAEPPCCTIVLWSRKSVHSAPVIELADAALASKTLVQVALEPVKPPINAPQAPIDFRGWNGSERGSSWRMLRERIEHVQRGDAPTGAPFLAVASLGMVSASILAMAVSDRVAVGPGADRVADIEPFSATQIVEATPANAAAMGGPILQTAELAPEGGAVVPVRLRPPEPLRAPRLRALPDISAPRQVAMIDVQGPGFLRQLINGVEDTLPFLNVSDASDAGQPIAVAPPSDFSIR